MKERITMQRLMQESWIPVLTGILSAGVILSLAHSTNMAYVTALLLMALYFVAIAANRVSPKIIVAVPALQQARQKIKKVIGIKGAGQLCRNALLVWSMQIDLAKNLITQTITALSDRFAGLAAWAGSMFSASVGIIEKVGKIDAAEHTERQVSEDSCARE